MVINLEQKKIHFDLKFILTYNSTINQYKYANVLNVNNELFCPGKELFRDNKTRH